MITYLSSRSVFPRQCPLGHSIQIRKKTLSSSICDAHKLDLILFLTWIQKLCKDSFKCFSRADVYKHPKLSNWWSINKHMEFPPTYSSLNFYGALSRFIHIICLRRLYSPVLEQLHLLRQHSYIMYLLSQAKGPLSTVAICTLLGQGSP